MDGPITRRVLWPRIVRALAVTADGQTLVHDDGGDVVVRDARSGLVIRRIDTADEELAHLVVAGTGDTIHVLSAGDREIALWDPSGRRIAEYTLAGTAPYLVRVYTGPGAHHDNVIEHARTWPTALAIRDDAQMVAIGAAKATRRIPTARSGSRFECAGTDQSLDHGTRGSVEHQARVLFGGRYTEGQVE